MRNSFYIVSNIDNAQNFKLSKTSENNTEKANWVDVISHREDVLLEGVDIFKDFLVVSERENGLNKIKISNEIIQLVITFHLIVKHILRIQLQILTLKLLNYVMGINH